MQVVSIVGTKQSTQPTPVSQSTLLIHTNQTGTGTYLPRGGREMLYTSDDRAGMSPHPSSQWKGRECLGRFLKRQSCLQEEAKEFVGHDGQEPHSWSHKSPKDWKKSRTPNCVWGQSGENHIMNKNSIQWGGGGPVPRGVVQAS